MPWTVALQAPLSMEFPRQEDWKRLPFPSPGDLPNAGTKPVSLALQMDCLPLEPPLRLKDCNTTAKYDEENSYFITLNEKIMSVLFTHYKSHRTISLETKSVHRKWG